MSPRRDDFFIGYLGRLPRAARGAIVASALGLILGFGIAALAIGAAQDDPGDGAIFWNQRAEARGVMVAKPYPHLRTAPSAEDPEGRSFLLVRPGKNGAQELAERFDGQTVDVRGVWSRRGDIEMIQLAGNRSRAVKASATPGAVALTPVEDRGRWRLSGEICDGKCWFGAMRPGAGLAHKACANLCLIGGAPPVLVTTAPVEGSEFMLLAAADGGPLDAAVLDLTAILLTIEGRLERRGDMLVLKVDLAEAAAP